MKEATVVAELCDWGITLSEPVFLFVDWERGEMGK
jgi:hypothetical protein